MKKVLMIAPCSLEENTIGGIVAKKKTLYNYIKVKYDIISIDTYWVKKTFLQYVFMKCINKLFWTLQIFIAEIASDGIILDSNEDNYIKYYISLDK